jgi:hypothetical protein
VEAVTLAAIGAVALSEGVRFLYDQAGEAIRWWRERRAEPDAEARPLPVVDDAPVDLEPATVDTAALERLEPDIRALRAALRPYVDDIDPDPVDPADADLVAVVDALRRAMEAVLGQRIRFRGEADRPAGPEISGQVDVEQVAGYAAAVRVRTLADGRIVGTARARRVEQGGEIVGVDADDVGR